MSVFSKQYFKGEYVPDFINEIWGATVSATCQDEDTLIPATARNGILDPGEDFNNSGNIEAGNVATVSPGTVDHRRERLRPGQHDLCSGVR